MSDKNLIYQKLKKKMAFNRMQISILKKIVMTLALMFIFISFGLFYSTTILINDNHRFTTLFIIILGILFISLVGIHIFKKNKEKETRKIDTQIYELLKLRI